MNNINFEVINLNKSDLSNSANKLNDLSQNYDCLVTSIKNTADYLGLDYNNLSDKYTKFNNINWFNIINNNHKLDILSFGLNTNNNTNTNNITLDNYVTLIDNINQEISNKYNKTNLKILLNLDLNISNPNNTTDNNWQLNQLILSVFNSYNKIKNFKNSNSETKKVENKQNNITYYINYENITNNNTNYNLEQIINNNNILAKNIKIAKDLANMPANICNPHYFKKISTELANQIKNINCEIFTHEQIEKMGMGAFAAVSQGSNHPGCMIVLDYNPQNLNKPIKNQDNPYVLIGKGITFDTGGYTLKPAKAMVGMKYDMSGAASVFATIKTVAELNLPIRVTAILACAENMIGHKSTRPDDIVTSLSGKTIEINNTDAEGRLVLCDSITYSGRLNPKVIIDVATLTGAAVVALGYKYTAAYSNDPKLQQSLESAAKVSNDAIWSMPLCEEYKHLMDSKLADLKNSSSMPIAGSITAANFLSNFVPDNCSWAHLDIAGSATVKSLHEESTGRPVPLLVNYLIKEAE